MKRLFSAKPLVVAALALGAVVAGTAAHARSDVILSIGLNVPHAYVQPAPVYVQPQPVYVQPRPTHAPVQTVYYYGHDRRDDGRGHARNGPFGDADRDGVQNRFDRDSRFYDHRVARHHAAWGDLDRDGVINKYDRAPRNPNRR